jgi:DNA invertase Pin-like site-specific DNA recombinase
MSKPKKAAIYVRVSSDKQTVENQILALTKVAERRGWEIAETYQDAGISGAKGRKDRPGLDQMLHDAGKGKFSVVMVWSIDRMGRSLIDLLKTVQTLGKSKVDLFIDQQNIDTTTPEGELLFHIVGAFGQFERKMIVSRVNAGLARARATGKTKDGRTLVLGRPSNMTPAKDKEARAMLADGIGILKIAKTLGVGTGTIQKIKDEMKKAA